MTYTKNIYLAPFQGITTHTFRYVYSGHFKCVSKYYTPFFSKIDHDRRLSQKKLSELQHLGPGYPEVVPQILSKDAVEIVRFAKICADLGYKELNWNLGCPFPQVADKKRGSGLMAHPEMVNLILEEVMPQMPIRFSIKCRLGHTDISEIDLMLPVFNNYNISELTVHGRIGKQLYSGSVDNEKIMQILPKVKSEFIHNGDVNTVIDFRKVSALMPLIDKWMIGRGILSNPFLPEEILGIDTGNRIVRLKKFLDELFYYYKVNLDNRLTLLNILKEYWDYLFDWFDNPIKIKRIIKRANTFAEYEDAVSRVFENFTEAKKLQ